MCKVQTWLVTSVAAAAFALAGAMTGLGYNDDPGGQNMGHHSRDGHREGRQSNPANAPCARHDKGFKAPFFRRYCVGESEESS